MNALLLGLSLGLGAGLAPGPLLALVIRSTAQGGFSSGATVAFSPLITDVPIILIALAVASTAPHQVLGALAVVGGVFVLWLGIEALREPTVPAPDTPASTSKNVAWGAMTNALSPHPWVFWITVGAPILGRVTLTAAILFLGAFYLLLIGTKILLAGAVALGRHRLLNSRGYTLLLRGAGLLLLATGTLLTLEGLRTIR